MQGFGGAVVERTTGRFFSHEGLRPRKVAGVGDVRAKKANKTESVSRKQRQLFRKWVFNGF